MIKILNINFSIAHLIGFAGGLFLLIMLFVNGTGWLLLDLLACSILMVYFYILIEIMRRFHKLSK